MSSLPLFLRSCLEQALNIVAIKDANRLLVDGQNEMRARRKGNGEAPCFNFPLPPRFSGMTARSFGYQLIPDM